MPTDEERREVAARLREIAPGSNWPDMVAEACGLDPREMSNSFHEFTGELCECLADLIEPEPERTCKMELVKRGPIYSVYRFSCCGYVHSENVTDGGATELPGTRCPKCGTKVEEER